MLAPEVTKGLTAAAAITLGLVVFLVAVEVLYRRVSTLLEERRRAGKTIEAGRVVINGFHADWAEPTYKLLRILTIVIVLVDVIPHLPLASSGFFQGVSLLIGAMVTLGSSSAVSNLVSGTEAGVEILSPRYAAVRDGNPSTIPPAAAESSL